MQGRVFTRLVAEIYRRGTVIDRGAPACIASNWNIYEPINHFSRCSPPYAVDTAPIGRRALGLQRHAGMLHRGSSEFFELLDQRGRSDDSREQQVQGHVDARDTLLQDAHGPHHIRAAGERGAFIPDSASR